MLNIKEDDIDDDLEMRDATGKFLRLFMLSYFITDCIVSWHFPHLVLYFFCKNLFYKNIEAEMGEIVRIC